MKRIICIMRIHSYLIFFNYVSVCLWVCALELSAYWVWKMVTSPLDQELQVAVSCLLWVLRTKAGYSSRAVCALNPWDISSAPHYLNLKDLVFLYLCLGVRVMHMCGCRHTCATAYMQRSVELSSIICLFPMWVTGIEFRSSDLWGLLPIDLPN